MFININYVTLSDLFVILQVPSETELDGCAETAGLQSQYLSSAATVPGDHIRQLIKSLYISL